MPFFHRSEEAMRRFYDGFHPFYRFVEGNTGGSIGRALEAIDPEGKLFAGDSVLEHCCGTGSLGLALAGRCASYEGRDQSEGMLERARERWRSAFGEEAEAPFSRQSVLDFSAEEGRYDHIMMAFALHLFSPVQALELLRRFTLAARKSVVVIDHDTAFSPFLSLVEAIEGGWYEDYRRVDFGAWARVMGIAFTDSPLKGSRVMVFGPQAPSRIVKATA